MKISKVVMVAHWLVILYLLQSYVRTWGVSRSMERQQAEVAGLAKEFRVAEEMLASAMKEAAELAGGPPATPAAVGAPAAVPQCPQCVVDAATKPWLVIGIPSVNRPNNDYVSGALRSYEAQLPSDPNHPFFGKIRVVVMNNTPALTHPAFYEAKERLKSTTVGQHFVFLEHPSPGKELNGPEEGFSPNKPNRQVRQQTRDVITLLNSPEVAQSGAQYFLFAEDDMNLCENGLRGLEYMIGKATLYEPNFAALRTSYGLCGVILHMADVPEISRYYDEHISRRPPDHLMVEWFAKETAQSAGYFQGRRNLAFRWNIYAHKGVVSSLRPFQQPSFPNCWEFLGEPVNFEKESFKPNECPDDDVWPCNYPGQKPRVLRFNL